MASPTFADAQDIAEWASRRTAQGSLPQLSRRLVLATDPTVQKISFRAGEGVSLSGWDGFVVSSGGNPFVPKGTSGWELSTSGNPTRKANEDYADRVDPPAGLIPANDSYVAVTARRWPAKHEWAHAKHAEGRWKDVRAYDADDLETWLERAHAVHTWFSILIGKHPPGITDLESYWASWSQETNPAISPELLLAGREEAAQKVREWLLSGAGSAAVKTESADEGSLS
ncbi:MAG: hypothetical protein ACLQAT_17745 [Candidatus Binataceae bacterium]